MDWHNSLFMGFPKGEGMFIPDTENDKKLWLANEMAFKIRKAIKDELGYNASAGISVNKTVAKIACTYNKPNGQTVVP
jgi:DNA polymerase-4